MYTLCAYEWRNPLKIILSLYRNLGIFSKSAELVHKKWKDPLQDKNPTSLFISKEKPRLYYSNLRDSNNINMKLACSICGKGS